MSARGSQKLPEAVSSVQPLEPKKALDGRQQFLVNMGAAWPDDEHPLGPGYVEHEGIPMPAEGPGDVYLLPVPPPEYSRTVRGLRKRRPISPVLVAKADPRCWSTARFLCPDLERLSVAKDGSVTIHNQPWQAKAARRKAAT